MVFFVFWVFFSLPCIPSPPLPNADDFGQSRISPSSLFLRRKTQRRGKE